MWYFAGWIVGVKRERVTGAAMIKHGNRQHSRTTWFGDMALCAFNNASAVRSDDTCCIEMSGMVEQQIRFHSR